MIDVYIRLIILVFSGIISYKFLRYVKKEPLLFNSMLFVYVVWHTPVILSVALPFTFPQREESASFISTIIILLLIHTIQISGILAYTKQFKHFQNNASKHKHKYISLDSSPSNFYVWLAYFGAFLYTIDTYLIKKIPFGLQLAENREKMFDSDAGLVTFLSVICLGIALYILNWFIYKKPNHKIGLRLYCFFPYAFSTIINFLTGNRQLFISGFLIILINYIYCIKPTFKQLIKIVLKLLILIFPLLFAIQYLRGLESETSEKIVEILMSFIGIKFIPGHPFTSFFENHYNFAGIGLVLYIYYGVQYDAFYGTMLQTKTFAPLTSGTLPVIYRRFAGIFGSGQNSSSNGQDIENFVGVWNTMFGNFYGEGGMIYVLFITLLFSLINFILVRKYLKTWKKENVVHLITFYSILILGIMFFPPQTTIFFFFVLAMMSKPYYKAVIKMVRI